MLSNAVTALRRDWAFWVLIGCALLARTLLAYHDIERPGLQYDETLFVNAATDRQPGLWIFKEFLGTPVMVFSYIGVLKSWLFTPVFALFDVRPATIRMPSVVLTSAAIGALCWAVRSLLGRGMALLVMAGLAFDASVFWLTRGDVGPSAVEFACKCLALGCAVRVLSTGRRRWVVALVLVLALGTFNKLNFIWTVNAWAAVSLVLFIVERGRLRAPWRGPAVIWGGGLAVLYAVFGWYYLHFDIGSYNSGKHDGSLLAFTWPRFVQGTNAALSGTAFHDLALGPLPARTGVTLVLIALFAVGATVSVLPGRTRSWPVAALAAITLLVAVQTLLTASATAPWHYVSPLPYGTIVAAYGVVAPARHLAGSRRRVLMAAIALAASLALVSDGVLMRRYEHDIAGGTAVTAWTPAIYQVDEFAQTQPGTIVTADWGVFNQLWALSPGVRPRIREEAFTVQGGNAATLGPALAGAPQPVHVILHGPGHDIFDGNRRKLLSGLRGRLQLARTITAADGSTMFEIYSVR